jgi:riboflavin kinase/FMN adenylyltransferase
MADLPPLPGGAVVTVGTFDGVHRGHRRVIEEVLSRARRDGRASVLVTFEPHPAAVLHPEAAPARLTLAGERTEVLAETGLDYVFVLRFDRRLAALEPERFVTAVLRERCQLAALVIGHDHGFGRERRGDADTLRGLGRLLGFPVDVVAPEPDRLGAPISSSRIRAAIGAGDLAAAAEWLGRPYRVTGRVERGARRGHALGVPTINLAPPPGKLLPPDGVYAGRVEWGGGTAIAMMNQGARPTVGDGRRWLEAHLLDFAGDLYGREVRIEWVARLRDTRRFESLEDLKAQLDRDRGATLRVLAPGPTP